MFTWYKRLGIFTKCNLTDYVLRVGTNNQYINISWKAIPQISHQSTPISSPADRLSSREAPVQQKKEHQLSIKRYIVTKDPNALKKDRYQGDYRTPASSSFSLWPSARVVIDKNNADRAWSPCGESRAQESCELLLIRQSCREGIIICFYLGCRRCKRIVMRCPVRGRRPLRPIKSPQNLNGAQHTHSDPAVWKTGGAWIRSLSAFLSSHCQMVRRILAGVLTIISWVVVNMHMHRIYFYKITRAYKRHKIYFGSPTTSRINCPITTLFSSLNSIK